MILSTEKKRKNNPIIFTWWIWSALICAALMSSCENDLQDIKEVEQSDAVYIETAKDVEITYTNLGKLKAKIFATDVRRNTQENPWTEFPKGVKLYTYNEQTSDVEGRLTANYGIVYEQNELMIVRDNVQVTNIKKEKIDTEELIWNRKTQKVHTDKFVTIKTPDEIIYGEGMDANDDFTNWTILNITGTVSVNAQGTPTDSTANK